MKKPTKNLIVLKFEEFIKEAICHHESNQHKANVIFKELVKMIIKNDSVYIHIEWSHYLMDEHTSDEFASLVTAIKNKYQTHGRN